MYSNNIRTPQKSHKQRQQWGTSLDLLPRCDPGSKPDQDNRLSAFDMLLPSFLYQEHHFLSEKRVTL